MITRAKLKIFEKYSGDTDLFARAGRAGENEILDHKDSSIIDNMIQNLEMIKKGLCSNEFKNRIFSSLDEQFELTAKKTIFKYCDFNKSDNEY